MPTRTCIGCRAPRAQGKLLRVRRDGGGQLFLSGRRDRGRSAYLCPKHDCFDRAIRKRAFTRAFRGQSCRFDPNELWFQLSNALSSAPDSGVTPEPNAPGAFEGAPRLHGVP